MASRTTIICDLCGKESGSAYGWAQIRVSGSGHNMTLMPDESTDVCGECWRPFRKALRERDASSLSTPVK